MGITTARVSFAAWSRMTYYIHVAVCISLAAVVLHTCQLQVKLGPQTKAQSATKAHNGYTHECVEHAYYRAVKVQSPTTEQ